MGRATAARTVRARRRRDRRQGAGTLGCARLKAQIRRALDGEITRAGLRCEAATGGITVEIDNDTDDEPDEIYAA